METLEPKCCAVLTFIDYHVMMGLTGVGSVRRPLRGILTRRADVASPGVTVLLVALASSRPFLMLSRFVEKKKSYCAGSLSFNLPTRDVTITVKRINRGKKKSPTVSYTVSNFNSR